MAFDNTIRVYNKNKELLAVCDGETAGKTPEAMQNMLVAPRVRNVLNGESTLSFEVLADSDLWQSIKDPENLYNVNGRWYTALTESAYVYSGEKSVRVVNAALAETWTLLSKSYNQAYNCGIYCYARASFVRNTAEGAVFSVKAADCSNAGDTIPASAAWEQIKAWSRTDEAGNVLSYAILSSGEHKPKNWDDVPVAVALKSVTVQGDTALLEITPRTVTHITQTWDYSTGEYQLDNSLRVYPQTLTGVRVNYTTTAAGEYHTQEVSVRYSYYANNGRFAISFIVPYKAVVNAVIAEYDYYDIGKISAGASCTFAYGAEVVDEHTFVILPKADSKYKLTIDGVPYEDSEVKDARGVIMPRGSGGYAMWAALKNSGWSLGICDVIAKDFDTSIDYGCFNIESDMKDVLYNVQNIQSLYGGLLIWDSENKVLNYRAENSDDYNACEDGFNDWTGYEFREGKNLTALPEVTYDNSIITRAYPLGYGGLNIKAVNGGKTYIDNFSFTDTVYEGYLEQPLIYDTNDEGGQRQLLYWGKRELANLCHPRKTITLSVKDIRTTEGCEHEVFDVANIVRVRYYDDDRGAEVVEQQRITVWEYNVFAPWDSLVEMGGKTQNLTELFKLIYKTQEAAPDPDASGKVSSNNVRVDGLPGVGGTLTDKLHLISQTTTHNSDAIAGLMIDTNAIYSQVQLFAQYQKQTDILFTETYAGLQFYADSQAAAAELSAKNYTDTAAGTLGEAISQTEANLKLYADQKSASAELSAKTYTDTTASTLNKALSDAESALSKALSDTEAQLVQSITQTESNLKLYSDEKTAAVELTSKTYTETLTNKLNKDLTKAIEDTEQELRQTITTTESGLKTYADDKSASALLSAQYYTNSAVSGLASTAYVQTYVTNAVAQIDIVASLNKEVGNNVSTMKSFITVNAASGIILGCDLASIELMTTGNIKISCLNGIELGTYSAFNNGASFKGRVWFTDAEVYGIYAQFA